MTKDFLEQINLKHIFLAIVVSFVLLFLRTCAINESTGVTQIQIKQDLILTQLHQLEANQILILKRTDDLEATFIQYFLYKNEMDKNNSQIVELKTRLKTLKEISHSNGRK